MCREYPDVYIRAERAEREADALTERDNQIAYERQRNEDLALGDDSGELRDVVAARLAIDRYTARCRAEDDELMEIGKRQAYQAWLHERDAS